MAPLNVSSWWKFRTKIELHKCKPSKHVCDPEGENQLCLNQTGHLAVYSLVKHLIHKRLMAVDLDKCLVQASKLWFYHMSWDKNSRGGQPTMKEEEEGVIFCDWVSVKQLQFSQTDRRRNSHPLLNVWSSTPNLNWQSIDADQRPTFFA